MTGPADELRLLGVVFAGGRSERMGSDKALLEWPSPDGGTTTLVDRAATRLSEVCERVEIAAGRAGRLPSAPWSVFADAAEGEGPLAGLLTALERSVEQGLDGVLALACDMPLVEARDLAALVARLGDADAALWVVDGRDQPLCAAYRTTCAVPARRAFDAGARRVVAIFEESAADGRSLRLDRVLAEENSALRLVNLNTKTDYDRALRAARAALGRADGPHAEDDPSASTIHRDGSERRARRSE